MTRVSIPWPDRKLSPNARVGWRALARAKKKARASTHMFAMIACLKRMDGCSVVVTFHPPDRRRRDIDNAISSSKAISDGIADVIGVDDSQWGTRYQWGEVKKLGAVVYEITPSTPFKGETDNG